MQVGKKKVGLFLPVPLADALDEFTVTVGKKQKWLIVGAALIRFLQSDQATQHDLIRQVKIADLPGGSFDELIAHAKKHSATSTGSPPSSRAPDFQQLVGIDDSARPRSTTSNATQNTLAGRPRSRGKSPRRGESR